MFLGGIITGVVSDYPFDDDNGALAFLFTLYALYLVIAPIIFCKGT